MIKYYLVKADTRDGEVEYSNVSTLKRDLPENEEIEAEEVREFAKEWFGFGKGATQEVRLRSYVEITKTDYEVLNKHGI